MIQTILALVFLLSAPLGSARERPTGTPLTLRIYNYARADVAMLREAATIAHEIYRRSGVATRWVVCELPGYDFAGDEPCLDGGRRDTLQLRLIPAAPTDGRNGIGRLVFGFALPAADGFGAMASVFWDRVVVSADASSLTRAQLLGAVMAHEAGHLLLGGNSHSPRGLMSGVWDHARFTQISQGSLLFVDEQRKRIEAAMRQRLAGGAGSAQDRERRGRRHGEAPPEQNLATGAVRPPLSSAGGSRRLYR